MQKWSGMDHATKSGGGHDRLGYKSQGSYSGLGLAEGERRMDANRFAALSRQVGAAPTRRAALGVLAAGLTGALVIGQSTEEAEAGKRMVEGKSA